MKKAVLIILGAALCIAIYVFGIMNNVCITEHKSEAAVECNVLTDEEIMNLIVEENYESGYYGVLDDDDNDDFIEYLVYSEDGKLQHYCGANREWYQDIYAK